jgi:hypothetical protein
MRGRSVLLAGGAAVVVAAATSIGAAANQSSSGRCGAQAAASSELVVTRTESRFDGRRVFSFPARVTVAKPGRIHDLAAALCRLPTFRSGHCPIDFFLRYHLEFRGGGPVPQRVVADPAGCETVTGFGPVRSATPAFWRALGNAIGLRNADVQAFRGRRR